MGMPSSTWSLSKLADLCGGRDAVRGVHSYAYRCTPLVKEDSWPSRGLLRRVLVLLNSGGFPYKNA